MPRSLRTLFENAWYHVMNRGINHQPIFLSNHHKEIFISLLEKIIQKYNVKIHAFCLMNNHYHLLVHTPFGNLNEAMRYLGGIYTQKFNHCEKKDGALFRGRYKAILIENDSQLLQVSKYIHLNPVEAKLCHQPEDYLWSSYSAYIGGFNKFKDWLCIDTLLKYYGESGQNSKYDNFVKGV